MELIWDETKRAQNLAKHGLDFADAEEVLASRFRLDIAVTRDGEARTFSMGYVLDVLAVLVVVHVGREDALRIISFRHASEAESEVYYDWLENECDEP